MISSRVIVASTSAKRWFDLDAVRTAEKPHGGFPTSGREFDRTNHNGLGGHVRKSRIDPAGAPPLDWHVDKPHYIVPCECPTGTCRAPERPDVTVRYLLGDTRDVCATIPDGSVDLVFTSPPFLALRSYLPSDHEHKHKEIGSEANPAAFLDVLLELTAEWRRVLAPHGTLAVELGDTYSGSGGGGGDYQPGGMREGQPGFAGLLNAARRDAHYETCDMGDDCSCFVDMQKAANAAHWRQKAAHKNAWPLPKSLACIPDLYKIALAYGVNPLTGQPSPAGRWRVRNDITWLRPNPPVGALGDKWRPASSRIIVACTGARRWFDLDAVRGEHAEHTLNYPRLEAGAKTEAANPRTMSSGLGSMQVNPAGAPPLDWHTDGDIGVGSIILATAPYKGSHYATFPPELPRKIIDCMCPRAVCRVCGKPRERVTAPSERYANRPSAGKDFRGDAPKDSGALTQFGAYKWPKELSGAEYVTLGWSDCGHNSWRPGHVLDPFAGTGTTLMAAQDLGRDATGIDLDERNVHLARERVGMFLEVGHYTSPVVDVVSDLL